jgi:3-oxoacyl-[acyl-carrier protein] reductase
MSSLPPQGDTLAGKVALVTGAGRMRGTGHSIALSLAAHGADVALHGSGSKPEDWPQSEKDAGWRGLESVAEEIAALGRRSIIVTGDLRDSAQVDAMVDETVKGLGRLDILVNNAAAPRGDDRGPLVDVPDDAWQAVLDVKLNGSFYASRAAARQMLKRDEGGRIINISSMAGKVASPGMAAYNVANAGVQMLGASLARELGPKGITVNSICIGIADTSRIDDMGRDDAFNAYITRTVPLNRMGTPEEIAEVIAFLCSESASYITGQSINVDGGVAIN